MVRVLALLFALWAGIVVGVSFLATPAKFLAPSLSLTTALDVGRYTFRWLANAELALAIVASVLCWQARRKGLVVGGLAAVWLVLLMQRFWLLPLLDERVGLLLAGSPLTLSYHHNLFIGAEALKVTLLILCAGATAWSTDR